jgi:hypothetical protein
VLPNTKSFAQVKGDNTIKVDGVEFLQVCNALLDAGYVIEKKDNELQTAKTELKIYPKYWNAYYSIVIRIKDSSALITAFVTGPGKTGGLFNDDQVEYIVTKKGKPQDKSLYGFAFSIIKEFALSFKKPVEYLKTKS